MAAQSEQIGGGIIAPANGDIRRRARTVWLAALADLSGHYGTKWLPDDLAHAVERADVDRNAGAVYIALRGGRRIIDTGAHLSLVGGVEAGAVRALAAAAQAKGWDTVHLRGSDDFKANAYAALTLLTPSIEVVGYNPPPDVRRRVEAVLAVRAAQLANTLPPPSRPPPPTLGANDERRDDEAQRRAADLVRREIGRIESRIAQRRAMQDAARDARNAARDAAVARAGVERAIEDMEQSRPGRLAVLLTPAGRRWAAEHARLGAAWDAAHADELAGEQRRQHLMRRIAALGGTDDEDIRRAAALQVLAEAMEADPQGEIGPVARCKVELAIRLAVRTLPPSRGTQLRRQAAPVPSHEEPPADVRRGPRGP